MDIPSLLDQRVSFGVFHKYDTSAQRELRPPFGSAKNGVVFEQELSDTQASKTETDS